MVAPGEPAPDFLLPSQRGGMVSLSDYRGRPVVVYFYPNDDTPVCVAQACAFRERYAEFGELGAEVIGVSQDDVSSHQRFCDAHQLPFPLLADTDNRLRKAFGVPSTLGIFPGRVTYVIDGDGIVRDVYASQFRPHQHSSGALAAVRELAQDAPTLELQHESASRRLVSYVPPRLLDRLASPEPHVPGLRRFDGAILFVDAAGFTSMAEQLAAEGAVGAEKLTRLLNDNLGAVVKLVRRAGGQAVKFAGDAIVALWPADGDLGAAVSGAVATAFQIQESFGKTPKSQGSVLSFKTVVGAGPLIEFNVGGALQRWEYLVSGDPLVQVGRLESAARVGAVLASAEAAQALGDRAAVHDDGDGVFHVLSLDRPAELAPTTVPALSDEATGVLWSYLPGAIRARLAAGQTEWLGELRRVTILFINLLDFDDGDDNALQTLQTIMTTVQLELYGQEGSVVQLIADDKGLTLIGALGLPPLAHEDDALRGVRAALGIQRALAALSMRCGIGVTTGRAFCGPVGGDERREFATIGDVVNTSARLMKAAGAGVLCDAETQRSCHGRIAFEALEPLALKGKAEKLLAFRPTGDAQQDVDTELFGRDPESASLIAKVHMLLRRESHVIAIEGSQGSGKSALVEVALTEARRHDVPVLRGRGNSIDQHTPYHAWRPILLELLQLAPGASSQTVRDRVVERLQDAPELLELSSLLGPVLAVDWADTEGTAGLEPEVRGDHTLDLVVRLLQRWAAERPVLIVLEDAHFLDSASWRLVNLVHRHVQPALIILAARGDQMPEHSEIARVTSGAAFVRLRLEPLTADDVMRLAAHHLGTDVVPDAVGTVLLERGGGNPFYSHALLTSMLDAGLITVADGRCEVTDGRDASALSERLPESFQAVITSRIDRLSPGAQLALKTASVIGESASRALLKQVHPETPTDEELDAELDELVGADLIQRTDDALRFRNQLVQEVVYGVMLFQQRRHLHAQIAAWHERGHQKAAGVAGLIAHHWQQAGETVKALSYLERAAAESLRSHSAREAIGSLERAIALSQARWGPRPGRAQLLRRGQWHRGLGEAWFTLGQLQPAQRAFESALADLGWPIPRRLLPLLLLIVIDTFWMTLHLLLPGVFVKTERTPKALSGRRLATLEAARAYLRLTELYYFAQDKFRVVHASVSGVTFGERLGVCTELAQAYANLSLVVATVPPAKALALRCIRRALEVAEEYGGVWTRAYVLARTAITWIGYGEWDKAIDACERSVEMGQAIGDWRRLGTAQTILSSAFYFKGVFQRAVDAAEDVLPIAKGREDNQQRAWASILQAEGLYRLGRYDAARASLDRCQAFLEKNPESATETIAIGLRASLDVNEGRFGAAEEGALKGLARLRVTPPTAYYVTEGFSGAAETFLRLWERGVDTARMAKLAREAVTLYAGYAKVFPLAEARATTWRGVELWLGGKEARARRTFARAIVVAEGRSQRFDAGLARFEFAMRLPSGAERTALLAQALVDFEAVEAKRYAARVRALTPAP